MIGRIYPSDLFFNKTNFGSHGLKLSVKTIKNVKLDRASSSVQMTEQEMINVLVRAGYTIQKKNSGGLYT